MLSLLLHDAKFAICNWNNNILVKSTNQFLQSMVELVIDIYYIDTELFQETIFYFVLTFESSISV